MTNTNNEAEVKAAAVAKEAAKAEAAKVAEAAKAEAAAAKEAAKATKSEASVVWSGGKRTYTKEVHGDAFADLAKEFAGKKNGKVV